MHNQMLGYIDDDHHHSAEDESSRKVRMNNSADNANSH